MTQRKKSKSPLSKINILDLSLRLPGPYGLYLLQKSWSQFSSSQRPFELEFLRPLVVPDSLASTEKDLWEIDPFIKDHDPLFNEWFRLFSQDKKKVLVNSLTELQDLPGNCNIWVMSKNLFQENLIKDNNHFILLSAHPENYPMHDLNAQAQSSYFQWHSGDSLPPLPWAGLFFGLRIKEEIMTLLLHKDHLPSSHISYLSLSQSLDHYTKELYVPHAHPILHLGAYPCYKIYHFPSHTLAVAAVERHYWQKFLHHLNMPELLELRFDLTGETTKKIFINLQKLSLQELKELPLNECCVTLVEKN